MVNKYLLFLENRENGCRYVSSNLYDGSELQYHMIHLDSIGVTVLKVICLSIDERVNLNVVSVL